MLTIASIIVLVIVAKKSLKALAKGARRNGMLAADLDIDPEKEIAALVIIVVSIAAIFFTWLMPLPYVFVTQLEEWQEVENKEIVAISDDTGTSDMTRHTVTMSSDNVYYYTKTDLFSGEEGLQRNTLRSDRCTIVEGDYSSPKLVTYQRVGKNILFLSKCRQTQHVFYVPEGTLVYDNH